MMTPSQRQFLVPALMIVATAVVVWCVTRPDPRTSGAKVDREAEPSAAGGASATGDPAGQKSASQHKSPDRFPVNDSFELPFLGVIRAHSRTEQVEITTPDGKPLALPMKVFYGADGRFIRGEYFKAGSTNYQFPAKQLQEGYESHAEQILGIPVAPAEVKLPGVLQSLYQHRSFDEATRINVTYIEFQKSGRKEGPVFSAEVWGVENDFFPLQHLEGHRKYRCIMNPQGKLIFFSNAL